MATRNKRQSKQQKSDNPNNPSCSPIIQALLDMQRAGFPIQDVEQLLLFAENNNDILKKADEIFNSHQYPDDDLTFFQGSRDTQVTCFLSPNELKILYLMVQNMRKGNLIELSIQDIKDYSDISDKTATKAISELKDKGCIAIQFNRNKTRGTVFMINPEISVVGKSSKKDLQNVFWHLTGSRFEDGKYIKSKPHQKWLELTKDKKYSRGYDKQQYDETTYYFNKLNEPNIKKEDSSDCQSDEPKTKTKTNNKKPQ